MLVPGHQTVVGNLTVAGEIVGFGNRVPTDGVGDLRVAQKKVVFSQSGGSPSLLRDHVRTNGDGAFVSSNDITQEIELRANNISSEVILDSARKGRADVGRTVEVGMVLRLDVTKPDLINAYLMRWGYFDDAWGYFFYKNENGLGIAVRNSLNTRGTPRSQWNVDPLDGSGPSGLVLDDSGRQENGAPVMFQILFSWKLACAVVFRVILVSPEGGQLVQVVHREDSTNSDVRDMVLPIRVECRMMDSSDREAAAHVFVTGRYFSILGGSDEEARWGTSTPPRLTTTFVPGVDVDLTSSQDVFRPLLSLTRRSGTTFAGELAEVEVVLDSLFADMLMLLFHVRRNAHLSGSQWDQLPNTSDQETGLSQDTSAASVSGGVVVFSSVLVFGNGQPRQVSLRPCVPFPDRDAEPLTICVSPVFKVGAAPHTRCAVSCLVRALEGW